MQFKDKTVWIVGASAGIGEHIAYGCAIRGARIILSARRKEALEGVARQCRDLGAEAHVYVLDVTKPEEIKLMCNEVIEDFGGVDILINNAGVSQRALVSESPLSIDRRLMEINYFGIVDITKRMLPSMLKQGYGHIAVTSSAVGKFGFPLRSAYAASKHALHGFFESLYLENRKHGIGVTIVCPGRVKTDVSKNALSGDGSAYGIMDPGQSRGMSAEECAERYIRGIERNRREIYMGQEAILIYLRRFIPPLFFRIAEKVSAK
ncbi:MAG: short chain dehydrogenase [Bacteroidetes bacterium]|nr:MAG: short chain dehydrogenase [Bacteroidota bacterium]